MELTFVITDNATPKVKDLEQMMTGKAGKYAAGVALRKGIRVHLRALPPNQNFPERTTGFYKQAAESVTLPEVTDNGVSVSITKLGIRQRYFGGPINPGPGKKYLTIPAQSFAYGRLAGEFGNVKFAFARDDRGYLRPALIADDGGATLSGTRKPRRKKGEPAKAPIAPGEVIFWLVKSVTQQPDPDVLPKPEEIRGFVIEGLTSFIRARLHDPRAQVEISEGNR